MICNMTRMVHGEEPDDCTKANLAMIDTLVSRGIHDYYWDEYWEQPGRMTFTHLMRSKHPEIGYIMAEQCDDVDSVLVAPLLWDAMPQTSWDPGTPLFPIIILPGQIHAIWVHEYARRVRADEQCSARHRQPIWRDSCCYDWRNGSSSAH